MLGFHGVKIRRRSTAAESFVRWIWAVVNFCTVVGCGNRSDRDKGVRFVQLLSVISHKGDLSKERHDLWFERIYSEDLRPEKFTLRCLVNLLLIWWENTAGYTRFRGLLCLSSARNIPMRLELTRLLVGWHSVRSFEWYSMNFCSQLPHQSRAAASVRYSIPCNCSTECVWSHTVSSINLPSSMAISHGFRGSSFSFWEWLTITNTSLNQRGGVIHYSAL